MPQALLHLVPLAAAACLRWTFGTSFSSSYLGQRVMSCQACIKVKQIPAGVISTSIFFELNESSHVNYMTKYTHSLFNVQATSILFDISMDIWYWWILPRHARLTLDAAWTCMDIRPSYLSASSSGGGPGTGTFLPFTHVVLAHVP